MSLSTTVDTSEIKPSMLVQMYIDDRTRGKSWHWIGDRYGKDPDEVYAEYMRFMDKNKTVNESEYRMLQLTRLEKMIDALWDTAINSKSLDHIKGMLPVLQEISKLLGLHKAKTVTEIRVIEDRQIGLVTGYLDAVTDTLLSRVLETVTSAKTRDKIEAEWDSWLADAAAQPLKAIESDVVILEN